MTWKQLGQHRKPILLANIKGFWDPLCALFDHMNKLAFIRPGLDVTYLVADRAEDILPTLLEAARGIPEADKVVKAANIEMI
jgi:predicted Rossmann-fold nucleotide-binding protein